MQHQNLFQRDFDEPRLAMSNVNDSLIDNYMAEANALLEAVDSYPAFNDVERSALEARLRNVFARWMAESETIPSEVAVARIAVRRSLSGVIVLRDFDVEWALAMARFRNSLTPDLLEFADNFYIQPKC